MTPRERIARLIDPSAPRTYLNSRRENAHQAAERILAAFPEIAGELGYVKGGRGSKPNAPASRVLEFAGTAGGEFSVAQAKAALPEFSSKEICNAFGYLCRHGIIKKIGYGRYVKP